MPIDPTVKMPDQPQIGPAPAPVPTASQMNRILTVSYKGRDTPYAMQQKLEREPITIGRAPGNDIIINSEVVSNFHAMLQLRSDGCYLIDGQVQPQTGQFEPSTNGLYLEDGRQVKGEYKLENGDRIFIYSPADQKHILLTYYSKADARLTRFDLNKKDQVRIGRLPTNDLVLPHLTVSGLHAELLRKGNGYVLVHKSHTNGTFVNGLLVNDRVVLNLGDVIGIGPFVLHYTGVSLDPGDQPVDPRGNVGYRVDAIDVSKTVREHPSLKEAFSSIEGVRDLVVGKQKRLLNKITLPIQPGDFVAVVGGSGTGKSTLLKSMIGILDTAQGSQVLIDGEDLFTNFNKYREEIGYVPQEDILYTDLTPWQVLNYAVRLRNSDVKAKERGKFIADLLAKVQLTDHKDKLVGKLSGGQKKRLSIAVELAADPRILVLDEPTSGLDPGLDLVIMKLLARLAGEDNKTVILVTHATENVKRCTKVAFLGEGGVLTFY